MSFETKKSTSTKWNREPTSDTNQTLVKDSVTWASIVYIDFRYSVIWIWLPGSKYLMTWYVKCLPVLYVKSHCFCRALLSIRGGWMPTSEYRYRNVLPVSRHGTVPAVNTSCSSRGGLFDKYLQDAWMSTAFCAWVPYQRTHRQIELFTVTTVLLLELERVVKTSTTSSSTVGICFMDSEYRNSNVVLHTPTRYYKWCSRVVHL